MLLLVLQTLNSPEEPPLTPDPRPVSTCKEAFSVFRMGITSKTRHLDYKLLLEGESEMTCNTLEH